MTAFKVIAHRGASAYAADNMHESFQLAIDQGADLIETDVQATADGALVLVHDWLVENRLVLSLTLADLSAMLPGVMTVAAALDAFGAKIPFCWEVKAPGIEAALVAQVRDHLPGDLWQQTEFTSFFPTSAFALHQAAPHNPVGWLTRDWHPAVIDAIQAIGLPQFCPRAADILEQPDLVGYANERGLAIRAWDVSDPAMVPGLAAAGVYGGTVNWPDKALAALRG